MRKMFRGVRRGEKGFTLIELLIVVAILGVLAAVVVPNLAGFLSAGNVAAANQEVASVETAAMSYYASQTPPTWPLNATVLVDGNYLNKAPNDIYTFDTYGKVVPADPLQWNGDTSVTWNAGDHKWE